MGNAITGIRAGEPVSAAVVRARSIATWTSMPFGANTGLCWAHSSEQCWGGAAGAADAGCDDRPVAPGGGDRRVRGRWRGGRGDRRHLCGAGRADRRPQRGDRAARQRHPRLERGVYSVPLRSGDQILTGRAEYGSNVLAYWQAARRAGAEVIVVPNDEHGNWMWPSWSG